jgi:hypothetical protein
MGRQYWILQADPSVYRVFEALDAGAVRGWTVARFQRWIAPGDEFAIWASGPASGICAFGVVTQAPELRRVDPAYWVSPPAGDTWQIGIKVTGTLESPMPRSEFTANPALATAPIIVAPQAGNPFPVTEAQWRVIYSRLAQLRSAAKTDSRAGPAGDELATPAWRSERKVLWMDHLAGEGELRLASGVITFTEGGRLVFRAPLDMVKASFPKASCPSPIPFPPWFNVAIKLEVGGTSCKALFFCPHYEGRGWHPGGQGMEYGSSWDIPMSDIKTARAAARRWRAALGQRE